MKIYSTGDVDLESLMEFSRDAGPEMGIEVEEGQFFTKSGDAAASLIKLLDHFTWWHGLGVPVIAMATVYGKTLAKSAAEDTWKYKKEIAAAATGGLKKLASAIAKLIRRIKPDTKIAVGLPFPDEWFSTHLELEGADEDGITMQLALFMLYLPELQRLIEELKENEPATGIFLKLLENGSLETFWFDGESLKRMTRTFQPPN